MRPLIILFLTASLAPVAQAGPCGDDVMRFEERVRRDGKKPFDVMAPQTTAAQLHRQPTPESVRQGEERAQMTFDALLVRARAADSSGDQAACQKALAEAKGMFDPM